MMKRDQFAVAKFLVSSVMVSSVARWYILVGPMELHQHVAGSGRRAFRYRRRTGKLFACLCYYEAVRFGIGMTL